MSMQLRMVMMMSALVTFGPLILPLPARSLALEQVTYEPKLYVRVNNDYAQRDMVIRVHRDGDDVSQDLIYPCAAGRCYFTDHRYDQTNSWKYFIERLDEPLPDEALENAEERQSFYVDHQANIQLSLDATKHIRALTFTKSSERKDYLLTINTRTRVATVKAVAAGTIQPTAPTDAFADLGITPDRLRLLVAAIVVVMVIISIKIAPLWHH